MGKYVLWRRFELLRVLKLEEYRSKLVVLLLLLISTVLCLGLGVYIRHYTGKQLYLYLNWDMFLAWVPVGVALLMDWIARGEDRLQARHYLLLLPVGMVWLFFYPNSGYLITDIVHPFLHYKPANGDFFYEIEFWHHLFLFFSAGVIGLLLSFYSLFSVQELVKRQFGRAVGWIFAVTVLLLSSYGIYIGRFIRWNSWDVFTRPGVLLTDLASMLTDKERVVHIIAYSKVIFLCLFLSYCLMVAFTTLKAGGGALRGKVGPDSNTH